MLAGELAAPDGQYQQAYGRYETLLRIYVGTKQRGADRGLAPKTRFGLSFRNLLFRAFAGLARLLVGADTADSVQLLEYSRPSLSQLAFA